MSHENLFFVFFALWGAMALGVVLFMWRASPTAKRTWFPRFQIAGGLLFALFTCWIIPNRDVLYFVLPSAALITFLNIRTTKFCMKCGAYHRTFADDDSICRKCGAALPRRDAST